MTNNINGTIATDLTNNALTNKYALNDVTLNIGRDSFHLTVETA
ncbi:hypothetical protein [Globicatella sanguinis]|nr:hypothetical protein [Globicatella sanguinis]